MRIALCSDEAYPVHQVLIDEISRLGHEAVLFGAIATGKETSWAETAEEAAHAVANGSCDEGIFLCWTGTGISMAANKVPGIRAALCWDPVTAQGSKIWNHANVLCLSNRTLSNDMAKEILAAWFGTEPDERGADGVKRLKKIEAKWMKA